MPISAEYFGLRQQVYTVFVKPQHGAAILLRTVGDTHIERKQTHADRRASARRVGVGGRLQRQHMVAKRQQQTDCAFA